LKNSNFREFSIRVFLASSSALLLHLAFPGPLTWMMWVCQVPMACAMHKMQARQCAFMAWISGFFTWVFTVWWFNYSLVDYLFINRYLSWFVVIIACGIFALTYAAFGFVYGIMQKKGKVSPFQTAILFSLFMTWIPHMFPANHLYSLYRNPVLIQSLEIGGCFFIHTAVGQY